MTTYIDKTYSTTFNNGFSPDQLLEEILADPILSALVIDNDTRDASGLVYNEILNNVRIHFTTVPTQTQIDAYDEILENHIPTTTTIYDNAIMRYDEVTGTHDQRSSVTLNDADDLVGLGTVTFKDVPAPDNPGAELGIVYKKSGNDGLFWKPDAAGLEVDLTNISGGSAGSLGIFHNEDEDEDTITSTSFQNKVSLTFIAEAADYTIAWYSEYNSATNSDDIDIQVQVDNSETIGELVSNRKSPDGWVPFTGWKITTLTVGSHTIDMDYKSNKNNKDVSLRRARLKAYKIVVL
jgi:hypothetical protein